jgi:NIMA (never in mitosis gene a)-related kinase
MIKDYEIKERLGIGSFGVVYKVFNRTNNSIYVIKQIPLLGLSSQQINDVKLEAKILSSVSSPYIVKYFDSFEENNYLNIVMEYCDGGDLCEYINKNKATRYLLKEDIIWQIFLKITIGLATLHKSKILHRDLKTLNIFLTKNLDIKIGDFGVAKILTKSGFAKTVIGTPYYLSPELCDEQPYNDKSDVWALGCILYELSTYKHPFNAKSQYSLVLKILQNKPEPIHKYYSEELRKLIYLILDKNHVTRPSCYDILNLPFVIEKAKKLGLYDKIKEIYPQQKKLNKKMAQNYSNKTYIHIIEKKYNVYDKKTFQKNTNGNINNLNNICDKNNKIFSNRYLKSEQNNSKFNSHRVSNEQNNKINKEKGIKRNNYNNHVLFVSKSNDNFKKIIKFRENRSRSCDRNLNKQDKVKIRLNKGNNIGRNLDNNNKRKNNISNISERNYISNISYINPNNQNYIDKNRNKIKKVNNNKSNKVINCINEFEKKIRDNQNNIKKVVVINNKPKKPINFDSNNLNFDENFFKNIKISDILDNKDIDTMIQKELAQNNKNKLINMKEFANNLNSYVSKVNQTDINNNNRNNNIKIKNNSYGERKLQINCDNNNYKNIRKIDNMDRKTIISNSSVEANQHPKYYEKLVVNNIYNSKEKRNNIIINRPNNNNIYINDMSDINKAKNPNKIFKACSNKAIMCNKKRVIINKNRDIAKNRINSAIYNQKTENINNYQRNNIYKYKTTDVNDNKKKDALNILIDDKNYNGKSQIKTDISD